MKYFLSILGFWMMPFMGMGQGIGPVGSIHHRNSEPPNLSAAIVEGRLVLDIPISAMDEPILWTRIDDGNRYDYKQIRFRKAGDKIYMEEHRIWSEAGIWIPLNGDRKLERNILGVFPIIEGSKHGYQIDITDLLSDPSLGWYYFPDGQKAPELNELVGTKQLDGEVMVKFHLGISKEGVNYALSVFFSFVVLSEPMEHRNFDYRMSFWIEDYQEVRSNGKVILGSITRRRLEKKFKDQDVSVPIEPISYILSPDIPEKWRPYVKAGIEEWLPAFESAGFKDAIVVKEVDSLDQWTEFGLGNSVVKWLGNQNIRDLEESITSSSVNRVVDLRSGEIIKSDILLGSPITRLMDEYFVRCAPLDPRAQDYPFPDELIGGLLQFLTAHETGHAFGIRDNHYGEHSYPLEKMGNSIWLEKMGHTPSIMSYARHNNIAQPEDSVPPYLLLQKVGPTDHYYIEWAYSEFPKGLSLREKENRLERIIRQQDSVPWYRFINAEQEILGPGATNEVVETDDPIRAAQLGLKNLERAMALMPTVNQDQKDNHRVERMYGEALELWNDTMRNVLSLIGGYEVFYKSANQPGEMYTPISWESQKEALDFLMEWAFDPPDWLTRPNFKTKIRYSTYPDQVLTHQQLLLFELLRPKRMKRLEHMQTIQGFEGILEAYLNDLQKGLFKELHTNLGHVGRRKQEVQLTYLDRILDVIEEERKIYEAPKKGFVHSDHTKGLMMGNLMDLKSGIEKQMKRNKQMESLGHWNLCLKKLDKLGME
ncbi:zinc-dependent metalloprotease [Flagellimonas amoyensis]|uniref:zinc-dependent metalloprotease n=1 Tax=Flagellimonas amoyensis TaxID=2169401 RepID=UPI000D3BC477|nr:zinc-dependent metalloprotease [Allomuricauda amoyensis]